MVVKTALNVSKKQIFKIIRTSTVGLSLNVFCKGLFKELSEDGFNIVAISSPDSDLDEVKKREGVKTIGVDMQRHISPFKDLKSLLSLIKIFRKEKPDMVHSITPKAGLLSMIAAKIANVPIRIHTFTGLIFPTSNGLKKLILKTTDRITCKCASDIMAEGEGIKSDLINNRITRKNITILGYGNLRGIDLPYYDKTSEVIEKATEIRNKLYMDTGNKNSESVDSDSQPFIFVFVGRFAADKGIDNLIEVFSKLINKGEKTKLLMVGDFDYNDPLKPETVDFIKNSRDILISNGWVKDIRPYLAAADALVFPSRREGFPNVVLEAGAMGLPSIVTDINGSREIITDGLNGKIIPPDKKEALFIAMKDFIEYGPEISKLASSTRKIIADRYEQSFVRDNLKKYYRELLSPLKSLS